MPLKKYVCLCLLVLVYLVIPVTSLFAQQETARPGNVYQQPDPSRRGDKGIRVMFYNTENLFDPVNDSATADDEYAAGGMRGWTFNRMQRKIVNVSKVILTVGGWEAPELVGLCEVENRYVLNNLVMDSPLKNIGYRMIHQDSPDPRGIDVALLYRPEKFKVLSNDFIHIRFPFDSASRTRDIVYAKGLVLGRDTLHVFVNHWPSRFGGRMATIPKRNYVASVLKARIDSITAADPTARIIVMGDLNDEPTDESVAKVLKAKQDSVSLANGDLYNMMTGAGCSWNRGTIKDKEIWITIDQLIVTAALLKNTNGLHSTPHSVHILDAPFLLQADDAWFGQKPFRTYYGARYIGGFSDHLPIYMDLKF